MISLRVADTSALYALFATKDEHHRDALEAFEEPTPIIVPSEIFSETIALIQYRQGFPQAKKSGDWLRNLPHLEILPMGERVSEVAWKEFSEAKGRLSYPDSVVVARALQDGSSPIAYDEAIVMRCKD